MTKDGSRLKIKLEMNDWVIAKSSVSSVSGLHHMYHLCQPVLKGGLEYLLVLYLNAEFPMRARHPDPCWACSRCLRSPPEELECLYLMLESEHAYAIMQIAQKAP
ncbi:hypothetical protein LCGC14_0209590 [marine sediment metagenome]|uniref:Uncharacterized protein n=1 Tax=marine sediment metagenome TaxID=412755 RepID=A0A0F9XK69_9ZZZZ